MVSFLERINALVWGIPTLMLIVCAGIYLSVKTKLVQVSLFPRSIVEFFRRFKCNNNQNKTTSYRSLCTALAATVGTGNIAGVAGAILLGGPGAVFWMWVSALLGMGIKFAEATLSVRYRIKNRNGEFVGGPMYMIENGLGQKWKWLGYIYAFLCVFAAFGVGNATQINAVVGGINSVIAVCGGYETSVGNFALGLAFGILIYYVFSGGADKIGMIVEKLIPAATVMYLVLGSYVLIVRNSQIISAFASIFIGAFAPRAITGGVVGSAMLAVRVGAARGTFTNEAGMGTAGIAHGSADVSHPVEQGLMGIVEVFLDTIVICTVTALVILCSGVELRYGCDLGVQLTINAFSKVYGDWARIIIALAVSCFALATILGWGIYGARCWQYLFGEHSWRTFALLQGIMVVVGSVLGTGIVWVMAEIVNGLLAVPNLFALVMLSPELSSLTKDYKKNFAKKGTL